MPSREICKKLNKASTIGEQRKIQADQVEVATWDGDIASRIGYLFDMYHDPEPQQYNDIEIDPAFIPLKIKYIRHTSQTLAKDNVSYHLQMLPYQECNVPYFDDYIKKYGMEFPIGLYVAIPDNEGRYNKWLIVTKADANSAQFATYEILRCDFCLQYILENKKHRISGVRRSQNSYNSGVWTDFRFTQIENQTKFIVPLNRETEKLYYDQRFIIDAKVLTEPNAWRITKVNRTAMNGCIEATLAQTQFNAETDYIEVEDGVVVGMWADYYPVTDNPPESEDALVAEIEYLAPRHQIRLNGSARIFRVTYYSHGEPTTVKTKEEDWNFTVVNEYEEEQDALELIEVEYTDNDVSVRFVGGRMYIGDTLIVRNKGGECRVEITAT